MSNTAYLLLVLDTSKNRIVNALITSSGYREISWRWKENEALIQALEMPGENYAKAEKELVKELTLGGFPYAAFRKLRVVRERITDKVLVACPVCFTVTERGKISAKVETMAGSILMCRHCGEGTDSKMWSIA